MESRSGTHSSRPRSTAPLGPERSDKFFALLSETFRTLGDTSRLKIVWALSEGEQSVGAICDRLNITQPAVSHHLRMLRDQRLVHVRREGTTLFYSLDDEHIDRLLREGTKHVEDFLP